MKVLIGFLVLGMVSMAAPGQEAIAPVVLVENAPDNRAGFEAFARMGLLPLPPGSRPMGGHFQDPALVRRQAWNDHLGIIAWQAPVSNDVVRLLVDNHWVSYPARRIMNRNARMSWLMMDGEPGEVPEEDHRPLAYLEEVDVSEAIDKLFTSLRQEAKEGAIRRNRPTSFPDRIGTLMVFASRLHQIGETNAANQLSAHLFQTAGKRETLMAGVEFIADDAYHQALEGFFRGGSVEDLIRDTESVRARFRQGWRKSAYLGTMIEEWKESLRLSAGELPAVDGVELNDRQMAFYRQFLDKPILAQQAGTLGRQNWLLQPKSMAHLQFGKQVGATLLPMDLRLDAIPALRVMLADTRPLPINGEGLSSRRIVYRSGNGVFSGPLARPLTLAELAITFLGGILPGANGMNQANEGDVDLLAESAMDFYKANLGKDRFAWARAEIEASEGGWNTPQEALLTLLASSNASDRAEAETFLLQSKSPTQNLGDVLAYAQHWGDAARPFVREYITGIESSQAEALKEKDSHLADMLKPLKEWLEPAMAEGPAPDVGTLMDDYLAGKCGIQDLVARAGPILKERPEREQQEILLPYIQRAHPDAVTPLLRFMQGLNTDMGWVDSHQHSWFRHYLDPDGLDKAGVADIHAMGRRASNLKPIPELWLPLLAEPTDDLARIRALAVVFQLLMPHMKVEETMSLFKAGDPNKPEDVRVYLDLARKALYLSAEESLEDLPTINGVTLDRRKEILAILESGDAESILRIFESTDWSERMFAMLVAQEPSLQAQSNSWAGLSDRNWVLGRTMDASAWQNYQPPEGFVRGTMIGIPEMEVLLRQAQSLAKSGGSGILMLSIQPAFRGAVLSHHGLEARGGRQEGVGIQVMFHGGRLHNQARLDLDQEIRLDKPEGEVPDADSGDGFEALMGGDTDLQWKQFVVGLHAWRNHPHGPAGTGSFRIYFQAKPSAGESP